MPLRMRFSFAGDSHSESGSEVESFEAELSDIESSATSSLGRKPENGKVFPFLRLPAELRNTIYELCVLVPDFHSDVATIQLCKSNRAFVRPHMNLFYVNRQIHQEAASVFYGGHTFRAFSTDAKYLYGKKPSILLRIGRVYARNKSGILARTTNNLYVPPRAPLYPSLLKSLELRFGPGWGKPPPGMVISPDLQEVLKLYTAVHELKVFVEVDPNHEALSGFRRTDASPQYEEVCQKYLEGYLLGLPKLEVVVFDAWPSVPLESSIMNCLIESAKSYRKTIIFGTENKWEKLT